MINNVSCFCCSFLLRLKYCTTREQRHNGRYDKSKIHWYNAPSLFLRKNVNVTKLDDDGYRMLDIISYNWNVCFHYEACKCVYFILLTTIKTYHNLATRHMSVSIQFGHPMINNRSNICSRDSTFGRLTYCKKGRCVLSFFIRWSKHDTYVIFRDDKRN